MLKKLSIALVVFGFFFSSPVLADHHEEGEGAEMSEDAGEMHDGDHGNMGEEHGDMDHSEDAGMGAKDKGKAKGADKGKKAGKKKGHDKHK